jgi:hypothetical protein
MMVEAIQVTCVDCGWVHIGLTPEVCKNNIENFNQYYETLDPEKQAHYGGPSTLKEYQHCHNCNKITKPGQFRLAVKTEVPIGSTIQSVMVENLEDLIKEKEYASS